MGIPGSLPAPTVRTIHSIGPLDEPDAAVTASRAEGIEQARAAAAVDAHAAVAAAELLEHVAVRGQREDVGAEEVIRIPAPDADDREEALGRRRGGRADHDAEAAAQLTVLEHRQRAGTARHDDPPTRGPQPHVIGPDPGRGRVGSRGQAHLEPAAVLRVARRAQHEQPRRLAREDRIAAPLVPLRHRRPQPRAADQPRPPGRRGGRPADLGGAGAALDAVRRGEGGRRQQPERAEACEQDAEP